MTMPAPQLPICSTCKKPVILETSQVDELGKPVHESCYLLKTNLRRATTPPEPPPKV
jgi:hypothetical protein